MWKILFYSIFRRKQNVRWAAQRSNSFGFHDNSCKGYFIAIFDSKGIERYVKHQ